MDLATVVQTLKIGRSMESYSLPVNLIRQWCFCPRVVYYRELLNMVTIEPLWSIQGTNFHGREQQLFRRRNLTRFCLLEGKKRYSQNLKSSRLQLHGIADLLIETENSIHAIEFKCSRVVKYAHRLQLCAYAMLAEENFEKPAGQAFILTENNRTYEVVVDSDLRSDVLKTRDEIFTMLNKGGKPSSSATVHQCTQCEYINNCNDR